MGRPIRHTDTSPGWIQRRFADLQRQINEERAAKRLPSTEVAPATNLLVRGLMSLVGVLEVTGQIIMLSRSGDPRFYLGQLNNNDDEGFPQHGFVVYRDGDGSLALAMFDADASDGYQQALNWYDRSGNIVIADDTNSGQGVARPYVPWSTTVDRDSTSSGAWTTMTTSAAYRQHPKVVAAISASADAGTAGELRVIEMSSGNVIAGPTTIPTGGGIAPAYVVALPSSSHMQYTYLFVQARVTSGGGSVHVRTYDVSGVQT